MLEKFLIPATRGLRGDMEDARGEDRCERKDGRHRLCGSACGSWGRVMWRRSLIVKAEGDCAMAKDIQLSALQLNVTVMTVNSAV